MHTFGRVVERRQREETIVAFQSERGLSELRERGTGHSIFTAARFPFVLSFVGPLGGVNTLYNKVH